MSTCSIASCGCSCLVSQYLALVVKSVLPSIRGRTYIDQSFSTCLNSISLLPLYIRWVSVDSSNSASILSKSSAFKPSGAAVLGGQLRCSEVACKVRRGMVDQKKLLSSGWIKERRVRENVVMRKCRDDSVLYDGRGGRDYIHNWLLQRRRICQSTLSNHVQLGTHQAALSTVADRRCSIE